MIGQKLTLTLSNNNFCRFSGSGGGAQHCKKEHCPSMYSIFAWAVCAASNACKNSCKVLCLSMATQNMEQGLGVVFEVHVLALVSGCQSGRLHQFSTDVKQVFNRIARAFDGLHLTQNRMFLLTLGGRILWDPLGQNPELLILDQKNLRSLSLRLRKSCV